MAVIVLGPGVDASTFTLPSTAHQVQELHCYGVGQLVLAATTAALEYDYTSDDGDDNTSVTGATIAAGDTVTFNLPNSDASQTGYSKISVWSATSSAPVSQSFTGPANSPYFDPLSKPLPILRLGSAVATLDANGIATAGPAALGDTIRVSLQDAAGSGYSDPTDGVTIVWRARDQLGNPVSAPFHSARVDLYVLARPEESDSTITIEVGCCTGTDVAEYHGFGLYYNDADGTAHRRSTYSGTAAATSDLLVSRANRAAFCADYSTSGTDPTKSYRMVFGGLVMNDAGPVYTQYVGQTGLALLSGDDLYFYASVYPTAALTNENTVAFQVRGVAVPVEGGTWDWRGRLGSEYLWQIGDSITAEIQSATDILYSNRYLLHEALLRRAPSRDVYPVGHVADAGGSGWRSHSGVGGATSASTLANIATYIAGLAYTPDIVTIMLGTNDAAAAVSAATFGSNMQSIVDAIKAAYPSCRIYVAYPTPTSTGANDTIQQTYSAEIDALTSVDGVADMRTGFNTGTMLDDAVHPNALGHAHIASVWDATIALDGD